MNIRGVSATESTLRPLLALLMGLTVAVLGFGCTQEPGPEQSAPASPTPAATTTATATPSSADGDSSSAPTEAEPTATAVVVREASDRLVVQHQSTGQLFTIVPDGTDPIPLTEPDGTINSQPTWSPDGSHVAWTNLDPSTGVSHIRSDRFDRTDPLAKRVPTPPFYLGWDDASAQIAFLAPSAGGIDFGLVEMSEEGEARRLDRGEPFYFSWGPLGDELLVHAAEFRLDRIDIDNSRVRIISETPAPFQAPFWVGAANLMVYGDLVDGRPSLVTSGSLGENPRQLATYNGYLTLSVSPDGSRIAFQSVSRESDQGIITASFDGAAFDGAVSDDQAASAQPIPTPDPDDPFADPVDEILLNTLNVMGVFGGDAFQISFEPALGFFWSPNNETLAFLSQGITPGTVRWQFWSFLNPNDMVVGPEFIPSDVMSFGYLPFFDQYEQNVEFWSPEGDRIVYAGTDPTTGESGVWTVEPTHGAVPFFVTEGDFAAWSPTTAGGGASAL